MKTTIPSLLVAGLAIACALLPQSASSHGAVTTTVLFDREIVRILNNRCVGCHMEGGISFPLSTYEQTWVRGRSIRTEILRRHMPPWPAVAGYGRFSNENALTLREVQFMVSWVEGLGPRNAGTVFLNVSDQQAGARPEVRASAHIGHWQLGEPDLTRQLEAATIDSRRPDFVRRSIVDLDLASERHMRALEYMPGDRRSVRGAVFTLEKTGQWLGSWTPWYGFVKLPDDVAYILPAGSRVVAEIHYRGADEPVVDRGTLGLFFAGRSASRASELVLDATAGGAPGRFRASVRLASEMHVWALKPDIDDGLESIEVSARRPDGRTDILLFARDVGTEWPTPFILKEPVLLQRGTELALAARADSASTAPRPRAVRLRVAGYQATR